MDRHEFEAVLIAMGPRGAWLGIEMPGGAGAAFARRSRIPVRGTLNGCPFRATLSPRRDGPHVMVVPKELQFAGNVGLGSRVRIVLEGDNAPRTVAVPPELRCALCANDAADAAFAKTCYLQQKRFVNWIQEARRSTTRQQRVAKTIEILIAGERLP